MLRTVRSWISSRSERDRHEMQISKLQKQIDKLSLKIEAKEIKLRKKLGLPAAGHAGSPSFILSPGQQGLIIRTNMTLMDIVTKKGDKRLQENMRRLIDELKEAIKIRDRFQTLINGSLISEDDHSTAKMIETTFESVESSDLQIASYKKLDD
ncbi:hypothetical protein HDE_01130 [Halotydeus destructor]|nr:hypothetical protein HDE_01130 [Halotydeus destructor]